MTDDAQLYTRLAAAYVRGKLATAPEAMHHPGLFAPPLDALEETEQQALIRLGRAAGLRLHRFKRTMGLPRVTKVLGILQGLAPANLLDIGSGRGAFLWPLLDTLPWLPVTALDILDYRVSDMQAVRAGGVTTLTAQQGDTRKLGFEDNSYDVVTILEVLEHVPATAQALAEVCRVAQRFVVLSVPSKPDNNPEHIHLFSAASLDPLLREAGATRISFDYVPGHMIAVAKVEPT